MTSLLPFKGTPNLLELAEAGAKASRPGDLSLCGDDPQGLTTGLIGHSPCGDEAPEITRLAGLSPCGDDSSGLAELSPCGDDSTRIFGLTGLSPCGDDFGNPAGAGDLHSPCADEISSDARLKTDIEQVGTTVYGLPLYHFRYRSGPERFLGVMAQDVLQVMPGAVTRGDDGFYRVNYAELGIRMTKA